MQNSFNLASLPDAWKSANVIAIHKKGDKFNAENYRQISLTPVEVKVMERIIVECMVPFLIEHKIIPEQQHGFLPGRSTTTNLLHCLNQWTIALDNIEPVDILYLDFSKAFDKVPTERLLLKLEHAGIKGCLIRWISDFLRNRKFIVKVGTNESLCRPVVSGVPQGSVLGPLLFLVYSAELPLLLSCNSSQYADDLKIFGNPLLHHITLQQDLNSIAEWCNDWLIPLNISKCVILHLGKNNPQLNYKVCGQNICQVENQKDLGVTISQNLTWSDHITQSCNKAKRTLFLIKKVFVMPNIKTNSCLYKSYVRPNIEYCSAVWSPTLVRDSTLIESVQRAATRLSYGRVRPSYEERLTIINLPKESDRLKRGDLITVYRILHNTYSVNLMHLFELNNDERLRGHSYKLNHEQYRTTARKNFLSNRVFADWNSLPSEVVSSPSTNSFKRRLDNFLFAVI